MKKFLKIFIDIFLIIILVCISVNLDNYFDIFIYDISIGIWISNLTLDIVTLYYESKYDNGIDKKTKDKVSMKIDCSNIKQMRIHKQQFDSIEQKADYLILSCIEDGRCIGFKRENGKLIEADFIKGE